MTELIGEQTHKDGAEYDSLFYLVRKTPICSCMGGSSFPIVQLFLIHSTSRRGRTGLPEVKVCIGEIPPLCILPLRAGQKRLGLPKQRRALGSELRITHHWGGLSTNGKHASPLDK